MGIKDRTIGMLSLLSFALTQGLHTRDPLKESVFGNRLHTAAGGRRTTKFRGGRKAMHQSMLKDHKDEKKRKAKRRAYKKARKIHFKAKR